MNTRCLLPDRRLAPLRVRGDAGRTYVNAFATAYRLGFSQADARDYAEAEVERAKREENDDA